MLTGDENIVDLDFEVQWRVNPLKASDFVFNLQNPEGTIKAISESAMREVIGRRNIQAILTNEQSSIAQEVKEMVQKALDEYGAGVRIEVVQLVSVNPPPEVRPAFIDVNAAQQDADTAQNEAKTYASREVPQARGKASPDRPAGRGLPDQGDGRRHRPGRALQRGLRLLQGRPGDQPRADLPGDDGEGPGLREQGDHRPERDAARGGDRRRRAAGTAALGVRRPGPDPDGSRPMKQALRTGLIAVAAIVAIGLYASIFTVGQMQQALVLQFGRVRAVLNPTGEEKPGLYFKIPFVENVVIFDKRVLDLDLPVQTVLTADRQNLEVDAFARYRILDPLRFYQAVGNVGLANQRLASFTEFEPAQRARPLDPRRHRQDRARPADASTSRRT